MRRDAHPELLEVGRARRVGVASRDARPAAQEQFGKGAHAGAGNADKMDWPVVCLFE
jgi:hypothetical protein